MERLLLNFQPDAVFELRNAELEGKYSGHDGLRRFFADFEELFEMFELHLPDVRDLGDRVLGLGTLRTIGRRKQDGAGGSHGGGLLRSEAACAPMSRTTASGVKLSRPSGCRSRRCRRTSRHCERLSMLQQERLRRRRSLVDKRLPQPRPQRQTQDGGCRDGHQRGEPYPIPLVQLAARSWGPLREVNSSFAGPPATSPTQYLSTGAAFHAKRIAASRLDLNRSMHHP